MKPPHECGPKPRPVARLSDPFERLAGEHDEELLYIGILRDATDDIRRRGFTSVSFIRICEVIAFIETQLRRHVESEERYLLPLMDCHLPGRAHEMRANHRQLWSEFAALRRHVQDIEEGRLRGTAITDLVESASLVAETLGNQIANENEDLFPEVKRQLSNIEYGLLAATMADAAARETKHIHHHEDQEGVAMTAKGKMFEENEPGKYYVTDECDGCGLCFSKALQNFMYSNDSSYYFVFQQPVDEREEADILEAIAVCPRDCIKSDGLSS